ISDYHYLTCFNKLYEKEKSKDTKLVFLPICGIGKSSLDDKCQKTIADKLQQLGESLCRGIRSAHDGWFGCA
ncbi:MAG: hypothetical protein IKX48_10145, partial [Victivallales bacterium]|nr:hypothetical protein [Victivallales bacterium]